MEPGNAFHLHLFSLIVFPFKCIWFLSLFRSEEQMAPGGRPSDCALPQVPGVFPQTAAVHLVAAWDPHHQDRVLLHFHGLGQRGMNGWGTVKDREMLNSASASTGGYDRLMNCIWVWSSDLTGQLYSSPSSQVVTFKASKCSCSCFLSLEPWVCIPNHEGNLTHKAFLS